MRLRDAADTLSALALVTQLGVIMFACVLLGLLGGSYLDEKLGTGPVLMIALVLVGVAGGMVAVYRMVMKTVAAGRPPDDQDESSQGPTQQ